MGTTLTLVARAVIIFLLSASSASAETTWENLQRFGLTGVWAYFCDRPATRINYFETYAGAPNGFGRREVDRGLEIPTAVSFVESAQIVSPSTLRAKIHNADPNWGPLNDFSYDVTLIMEVGPKTKAPWRIRFLASIRGDGKILAKNGVYFGAGQPTAWQYKCPTSMSAAF